MTQSDMIRLAHEAGWKYADGDDGHEPLWKFGELVAAAEREACAKVCENGTFLHDFSPEAKYSRACARAIRARGQHGD
jgi:hypothetical protein